jgi:hypothetical protein
MEPMLKALELDLKQEELPAEKEQILLQGLQQMRERLAHMMRLAGLLNNHPELPN